MISRLIFIVLNSSIITYQFLLTDLLITPIFLIGVLIIQIISIKHYLKQKDDRVLSFIESVITDDNVTVNVKQDSLYNDIKTVVNDLIEKSRTLSIKNSEREELLDNLLDHIDIGIIIFDSNKRILLQNREARKFLLNNEIDDLTQNVDLHINKTEFYLYGKKLKILSFQNIKQALDDNELKSWNELLRTLNHEIMNSITPISSLSGSALALVDDNTDEDLVEALNIINNRSCNLLQFVENYRNLYQIPQPKREVIKIQEIIKRIQKLMLSYLNENKVEFCITKSDIEALISVDVVLFENIIINLIKNSVEANSKIIEISWGFINDRTVLNIRDNGLGFSKESLERAYLPFYTTKSKGSGLGLSIIRQIMFKHNGSINIENIINGSLVQLFFP